mgnify:CR=1 FL=1
MKTSRMGKAAFSFYKWLGFVIAVIISAISAVLGYLEGTPSQLIILYTVAIFGSILWGWYHLSVRWKYNEDEDEKIKQAISNSIQEKMLNKEKLVV